MSRRFLRRRGHRILTLVCSVLVAMVPALSAVASTPPRAATTAGTSSAAEPGITSVSARDTTIVVTGTVPDASTPVAVYALGAQAPLDSYTGTEPATSTTSDASGGFTATLPRMDPTGQDRLYDQYVVVSGGETPPSPSGARTTSTGWTSPGPATSPTRRRRARRDCRSR